MYSSEPSDEHLAYAWVTHRYRINGVELPHAHMRGWICGTFGPDRFVLQA